MSNFIMFVSTVFGGAWELFQIKVPGFDFSYADLVLACAFATVALALIKHAFNAGGVGSKGRSTRNPKISTERKNDAK